MVFEDIYDKQIDFQKSILDTYYFDTHEKLPQDNVKGFSYHIQQLMSEIGEVLEADKRWKNIRKGKYDIDGKIEEIADCFIVLMNVAIFSGLSGEEVAKAIDKKIEDNIRRQR